MIRGRGAFVNKKESLFFILVTVVAIEVVCFGTGGWIGNNMNLADVALCLFKILRDLVA